MHRLGSLFWSSLFLLFALGMDVGLVWSAEPLALSVNHHPTRYALLIGITHYQALPSLPGSRNDIDLFKEVLTAQLGFFPEHVQLLVDAAATRKGILEALQNLVHRAGPQDTVFIHFSGHGSQIQDFNGDEVQDHLDETLVPFDGRTHGVPDILDDELEDLLAQLQVQSALVVLDSCHSGTATRGLEFQTRTIPSDPRLFLYQDLGQHHRGSKPPLPQHHVLMTGASAHERTLDVNIGGKYYGLFSYALFQSLRAISPEATAGQLFWKTRRELLALTQSLDRRILPTPQLEVPLSQFHDPLFPPIAEGGLVARSSDPLPGALPIMVNSIGHGQVSFRVDRAFEAPPGSVWALYSPDTLTDSPVGALGYVIIEKPSGPNIIGKVYPVHVAIPRGTRAVLVTRAPVSQTVPIQFRGLSEWGQANVVEQVRQEMGGVEIVNPGQASQFSIEIQNDVVHIQGTSNSEESTSPFALPSVDFFKNGLGFLWEQELSVSDLLALHNPFTTMALTVKVVGGKAKGEEVLPARVSSSFSIMQEGATRTSANSLQLEVQADRDGYLTIVDVDQQGKARVLFPNFYQDPGFLPDGFVKGSRRVLLPDSLLASNTAGFHWDIVGPSGTDVIKVFFTPDRILAERFRQMVRNEDGYSEAFNELSQSANFTLTNSNVHEDLFQTGFSDHKPDAVREPSVEFHGATLSPLRPSLDWTAQSLTLEVLE